MIVFPVLVVFLTVSLFVYLVQLSRQRPENFPPGPPRLPLWGSYWFMLKQHYRYTHVALEKLAKKYNTDIIGLYLGGTPCIVPISYDLCREALLKEEFTGRNDTNIIRMRGMGELRGIFFIDGEKWRDQRRFSLRHMRDFGFGRRSEHIETLFIEEVKELIHFLTSAPRKEYLDIFPETGVALMPDAIYGPALTAIMEVLSSTRFDSRKLLKVAHQAIRFQRSGDATGSAISMTPFLSKLAPGFFGYKDAVEGNQHLLDFIWEVVREHKKTFSADYFRDFIDVFINEQKLLEAEDYATEFTDEQLVMTVIDYMFPSAIAIGHTMNFYFALVANHPEVQECIQKEIDTVVGRSRMPTLDDRKLMPYTEASIREGIRFMPLNPLGIPRRCVADTMFAGYFIPKNTIVMPSIWTAHKDLKVWPEAEKFKPERFLDENGELLKKDLTIGFGAGKRLCAGETFARHNMFLMASGLLQHFTISPAYTKNVDLTKIVPGVNISIDNNYLRFTSR